MTANNPVISSPRNNIKGNDLPTKVRAFKASQISKLPSIHKSIVNGGLTFTSANNSTNRHGATLMSSSVKERTMRESDRASQRRL